MWILKDFGLIFDHFGQNFWLVWASITSPILNLRVNIKYLHHYSYYLKCYTSFTCINWGFGPFCDKKILKNPANYVFFTPILLIFGLFRPLWPPYCAVLKQIWIICLTGVVSLAKYTFLVRYYSFNDHIMLKTRNFRVFRVPKIRHYENALVGDHTRGPYLEKSCFLLKATPYTTFEGVPKKNYVTTSPPSYSRNTVLKAAKTCTPFILGGINFAPPP